MTGRDPAESHRVATHLELLFDLCFVVAVSQAAGELHHDLAAGHLAHGIGGYLSVFFAIWWAWMNFTWFASAYDTDDVLYRLLTFLQIVGVLVLASGIDLAFDKDFKLITVGYVIMRIAMVAQWLRAAASDSERRNVARRYATAVSITQLGWIGRLFLPDATGVATFLFLVLVEVAGPVWAERTRKGLTTTPWHPDHIAERYGLFTIIVLGECILSAFVAINDAISDGGASAELLIIAVAGLTGMFGLWWAYFRIAAGEMLEQRRHLGFVWGYVHYGLFAAIAAFGAGIAVVAEWSLAHDAAGDEQGAEEIHFALSDTGAVLTIGIPVGSALLILAVLRSLASKRRPFTNAVGYGAAVAVVVAPLAAGAIGVPGAVLAIGAIVAIDVAVDCLIAGRAKVAAHGHH